MKRLRFAAAKRVARGDDDPLSGVANLFDAAVVLSVGLMLAVVASVRAWPGAQPPAYQMRDPATGKVETVASTALAIERLQATDEPLAGEGTKLGVAYRLKSGEVVYVPETPPRDDPSKSPPPSK